MNVLTHIVKQHATMPDLEVVVLDGRGEPVDLTTATSVVFKMALLGDSTTIVGGACTVVEAAAGSVSYSFTAADTQISGTYLGTITANFPGSENQVFPFNDYFLIIVDQDLEDDVYDPDIELVFATVAQARAMGYELSQEQLLRAQGHIEIMCGRMIEQIQSSIANETMSAHDLARLKKATVYQAVWVAANPDVEERTDVTTIRTAGLSGESASLTADGITLAPLARRVLIGLSWVRSRSIRTSTRRGMGAVSMNTDLGSGWKGM